MGNENTKSIWKNKKIIDIIFWIIWLWEFVANIWYTAKYYLVNGLNSDYAGDAVLAKHLADSGKWILSEDWYPTTEVYVVHHQLIMTPMFRIFGDYRRAWIGTSVVAFLLMSVCVYWFVKRLCASRERALFAVVLSMNPILTFQMSFSVWFHGYLFYYLLGFVVLGLVLRHYGDDKRPKAADYAIVAAFSVLAGLCGLRMFMIVFIPLAVAYFLAVYNTELKALWNSFTKVGLTSLASAVVGFGIYMILISPKYGNGDVVGIGITLYDAGMIRQNLMCIPQTLIDGLSINFNKTSNVFYAAQVAVLAVLWIIVLADNLLLLFDKEADRKLRFVSLFAFTCMLVNLAFMVITQSNDEYLSRYRYFAVSTFLQMPVFAMNYQFSGIRTVRELFKVCVIVVAFIMIAGFQLGAVKEYGSEPVSWRQPYLDFLVDNGYTFGYATYWNADISIMMTDGKVQMASVNNDEEYSMFKWNTQRSFEGRAPEFVLMSLEDYENRDARWKLADEILYEDDEVIIYR